MHDICNQVSIENNPYFKGKLACFGRPKLLLDGIGTHLTLGLAYSVFNHTWPVLGASRVANRLGPRNKGSQILNGAIQAQFHFLSDLFVNFFFLFELI